jgi:hypothetical protein
VTLKFKDSVVPQNLQLLPYLGSNVPVPRVQIGKTLLERIYVIETERLPA